MPELRRDGDVIAVPDQLVEYYERQGWDRIRTPQEIESLRGAALDAALEEEGLPKSGKADDKRARLADDQKEN